MSHAVCHVTSWQPGEWKHSQPDASYEEEKRGIFAGKCADQAHSAQVAFSQHGTLALLL